MMMAAAMAVVMAVSAVMPAMMTAVSVLMSRTEAAGCCERSAEERFDSRLCAAGHACDNIDVLVDQIGNGTAANAACYYKLHTR